MAETTKGGPFQEILEGKLSFPSSLNFFSSHPLFVSSFSLFPLVDIFVNCIYLTSKIPSFVSPASIAAFGEKRALRVVVDVSCDTTNVNNPIPIYDVNTTFDKPTVDVPGWVLLLLSHSAAIPSSD